MERGSGSQALGPHCVLFSPPSVRPFPRLQFPPYSTPHHYTEPGEGGSQHLGICWPAAEVGQWVTPYIREYAWDDKGSFSLTSLFLTCTTSLAPAASAKVTPPQSRTTTLTGSAPRMGEGGVPRCSQALFPNLPPRHPISPASGGPSIFGVSCA